MAGGLSDIFNREQQQALAKEAASELFSRRSFSPNNPVQGEGHRVFGRLWPNQRRRYRIFWRVSTSVASKPRRTGYRGCTCGVVDRREKVVLQISSSSPECYLFLSRR